MSNNQSSSHEGHHLSVGRFALATQLSRKALRLYDQLGILVPDYVDPNSGYRYYNKNQFEKARFIRLMREMEMPLADIRCVLAATTADEAIQLIVDYQKAFEKKVYHVGNASQKVLSYLRKECLSMSFEISVEKFPARQVISIRKHIIVPAFHEFIPQALSQLSVYVSDVGVNVSGDPFCFYYGPVNEGDDGPVEICLPVDGKAVTTGDILAREIPAHHGAIGVASPEYSSFPAILEVWDAVISWVHKNKFNTNDNTLCCYEIWHEDNKVSIVQPFESNA